MPKLNSEEVADIEGVDIVVGNDQKAKLPTLSTVACRP